jgi:hypothetical protein
MVCIDLVLNKCTLSFFLFPSFSICLKRMFGWDPDGPPFPEARGVMDSKMTLWGGGWERKVGCSGQLGCTATCWPDLLSILEGTQQGT